MRPKHSQRIKQPTPIELRDDCLNFLRRKFYNQPGDDKCFAQDRSRLLAWVVLWPASWLNGKGVTIHGDAYRKIFMAVFMQASAYVQSKVKYRPAYLRQVIQSHFKIHGEEYYEEAKSVRNQVESIMLLMGKTPQAEPDPVRELAAARALVAAPKAKRTPSQAGVKGQLNLFG
jgi:hypothetical protein